MRAKKKKVLDAVIYNNEGDMSDDARWPIKERQKGLIQTPSLRASIEQFPKTVSGPYHEALLVFQQQGRRLFLQLTHMELRSNAYLEANRMCLANGKFSGLSQCQLVDLESG